MYYSFQRDILILKSLPLYIFKFYLSAAVALQYLPVDALCKPAPSVFWAATRAPSGVQISETTVSTQNAHKHGISRANKTFTILNVTINSLYKFKSDKASYSQINIPHFSLVISLHPTWI